AVYRQRPKRYEPTCLISPVVHQWGMATIAVLARAARACVPAGLTGAVYWRTAREKTAGKEYPAMSIEEHKVLVRRFEEAMNTRQLDRLDDIIAPHFVRHCQATPDLDIRSREQFKEFLRQDAATFPDNRQTFTHI